MSHVAVSSRRFRKRSRRNWVSGKHLRRDQGHASWGCSPWEAGPKRSTRDEGRRKKGGGKAGCWGPRRKAGDKLVDFQSTRAYDQEWTNNENTLKQKGSIRGCDRLRKTSSQRKQRSMAATL
eukprot:scaffold127499_cov31-Tisochrysis_lutea.AAC.5